MIRFLSVLAVLMLVVAAPAAAEDVFLGGKGSKKDGESTLYNTTKNSNSTVYKGPAAKDEGNSRDHMAQLMEENRKADYELVKNNSLKTKERIMSKRAERAANRAAKAEQKAALKAQEAAAADPAAAAEIVKEEKKKEATKKVYVKKSSGGAAPKKVFNSYD